MCFQINRKIRQVDLVADTVVSGKSSVENLSHIQGNMTHVQGNSQLDF